MYIYYDVFKTTVHLNIAKIKHLLKPKEKLLNKMCHIFFFIKYDSP